MKYIYDPNVGRWAFRGADHVMEVTRQVARDPCHGYLGREAIKMFYSSQTISFLLIFLKLILPLKGYCSFKIIKY